MEFNVPDYRAVSSEIVPLVFRALEETPMFQVHEHGLFEYVTPSGLGFSIVTRSEVIRVEGIEIYSTPISADISTLTMMPLLKGQAIDGIVIKSLMIVQLRNIPEGTLAETWLEGVYEYGVGENDLEALRDLLTSLSEYMSVLTRNKESLGDVAKKELDALQKMIESRGSDLTAGH